jgi:hypothetical protein
MTFVLPRLQLLELNDQAWVPDVVRDTVVDALSRTLRWGRVLDALAEPFSQFLARAGVDEVLDLGSGAGGPACILGEALERRGHRVRFVLSDLHPRPEQWRALRASGREWLDFVPEPVDAARIPVELTRGRARLLLNVLHHFPRVAAAGVLHDAVASRAPLFVAEGFPRNPLRFLPFVWAGLPALMATPLLARDRRLQRAAFVWGSPLGLLVSAWDGFVSTLRIHTPDELRAMVHGVAGFEWSSGHFPFWPGGRGFYFQGVPAARAGEPAFASGAPSVIHFSRSDSAAPRSSGAAGPVPSGS